MITGILATKLDGSIGTKSGTLPWGRIPEDLRFFREKIRDGDILVGRKTFETLPPSVRKGGEDQRLYVLTRGLDEIRMRQQEGERLIIQTPSDKFLDSYRDSETTLYICGGASIYEAYYAMCEKFHLSYIYLPLRVNKESVISIAPFLSDLFSSFSWYVEEILSSPTSKEVIYQRLKGKRKC